MAVKVKHKTITGRPVAVADWNSDETHEITGTPGTFLGFGDDGKAIELAAPSGGGIEGPRGEKGDKGDKGDPGPAPDLTNYYTKAEVDALVDGGEGPPADTTKPQITSGSAFSTPENQTINGQATANEAGTWSKGGTHANLVTLNPTTGAYTIAAQDFDAGLQSISFTLTITDAAGNVSDPQTITWTITDVAEGGGIAAPAIQWVSDSSVRDPVFRITSAILAGDVATLYIRTGTADGPLFDSEAHTISELEADNGEVSFPTISTLGYGETYFATLKITRSGVESALSAPVSRTIDEEVVAPPVSAFMTTAGTGLVINNNFEVERTGASADTAAIGTPFHPAATANRYFEVSTSTGILNDSGYIEIGVATSALNLNTYPSGTPDATVVVRSGAIIRNGTTLATAGGVVDFTTLGILIKNGKLYVYNSYGWGGSLTNQDPVAETGGVDISAMGNVAPVLELYDTGKKLIVNFGQTPFTYASAVPQNTLAWNA